MKLTKFRDLIGNGKTNEAIVAIKKHITDETKYQSLFNTILLIQSQFTEIRHKETIGLNSDTTLTQINHRLLNLIDDIETTDGVIFLKVNGEKNSDTESFIFKRTDNELYNEDFYIHFNSAISNAKREVLITGEGFEAIDERGAKLANEFVQAIEIALKNNVTVSRIQTKKNISTIWKDKLNYLLDKYPKKFNLYLINDDKAVDLSSICIIDATLPLQNNIVEFMLSINEYIEDKEVNIAGLAFFIHGEHDLAMSLRHRFNELRKNRTVEITKQNLDAHIGNRKLYFAYGANMDLETIKKRCPSAKKLAIGVKENYSLVFNRKGSYRPGGVSSIEPSLNNKVLGIIYSISEDDLIALDAIEDPNAYLRDEMNIADYKDKNKIYQCQVYFAYRVEDIEPDKNYLELIISAAENEGLPKWYLDSLIRFKK